MYDDVDVSGGVLDVDPSSSLMSQQAAEPMYVDDDIYMDDMYSTNTRSHLEEMSGGVEDRENIAYYERISVSDLFDQCILPTMSQAFFSISPIAGLCVVCRISVLFCHVALYDDPSGKHLASFMCMLLGLFALYTFYQESLIFIVTLALLVYPLLMLTCKMCRGRSGVAVGFVTLVYLLTCELAVVKKSEWHNIRGALMILAMKLISLAFDLDSGAVRELPSVAHYGGYLFNVGSVLFGPWTSYHDFLSALNQPSERIFDFYWVWKIVSSFCLAFTCVQMSTCVSHYVILDESFLWVVAFRDALAFRFSHYFICCLSEVLMTLTGFGGTRTNGEMRWDLTTARIIHVEFPRSLVEVVINWNLPIHHWLKTYIFKTTRPLGNFAAILLTYVASSVLHGVNFQLSAVLLSLGAYTYVEYSLRSKLAEAFSACILARRCKPECGHALKSTNVYVVLVNISFSCLAMFHLMYLGLMFDSSDSEATGYSMEHTLTKWGHLGFASHWVALASYMFCLLI